MTCIHLSLVCKEQKADSEDLPRTKHMPKSLLRSIQNNLLTKLPIACFSNNNTVILHVVAYETCIRPSDLLIKRFHCVSLLPSFFQIFPNLPKSCCTYHTVSYILSYQFETSIMITSATGRQWPCILCRPLSHWPFSATARRSSEVHRQNQLIYRQTLVAFEGKTLVHWKYAFFFCNPSSRVWNT